MPLAASDGDVLPIEVEAPAVPLNRAEEEQVAGRLTQAEILDKYGLRSQAVEQVREVVHRFPGHVAAHERLLEMLREAGEAEEIRDALVGLALALRASGDADGAGRYARDAATVAPLDPARRDVLVRLGLIEGEPAPPVPAKPSSGAGPVADGAVLIDFDAVEADGADVAAAPEPVAASAPASVSASAPDADEDLRAIAAALEDELFADDASPVPEVETEQSIGDVFAAFRKQVEQQVDQDDYRTHYDLGIAYKEMGLVDEAIEEFRRASSSPEFGREAFAMMALCHRAQADAGEAARCYLRAIEISNGDAGTVCQLRYELAEVLLEAGDRSAALDQFRSLLDADPGFRDVRDRVAELETVS